VKDGSQSDHHAKKSMAIGRQWLCGYMAALRVFVVRALPEGWPTTLHGVLKTSIGSGWPNKKALPTTTTIIR